MFLSPLIPPAIFSLSFQGFSRLLICRSAALTICLLIFLFCHSCYIYPVKPLYSSLLCDKICTSSNLSKKFHLWCLYASLLPSYCCPHIVPMQQRYSHHFIEFRLRLSPYLISMRYPISKESCATYYRDRGYGHEVNEELNLLYRLLSPYGNVLFYKKSQFRFLMLKRSHCIRHIISEAWKQIFVEYVGWQKLFQHNYWAAIGYCGNIIVCSLVKSSIASVNVKSGLRTTRYLDNWGSLYTYYEG